MRESSADLDVDDVDLKISSFWLHQAWFQKKVWEKEAWTYRYNTNAADETF